MKIVRHTEKVKMNNWEDLPKFIQDKTNKETYKPGVNMFSMFDVSFMTVYGLTSEEYNHLAEEMEEWEFDIVYDVFEGKKVSFTDRREALEIIHKYKEDYHEISSLS